jgi:hypothetical protein
MNIYILKNIIATKMGQSKAAVGPFPLKQISKRGAKKVENQTSPILLFKIQDDLVS